MSLAVEIESRDRFGMMGSSTSSPNWLDLAFLFLVRPLLAALFVLSLILLSWYVAWKTVLVHVPLVQEIFGLRKKQVKPKPPGRHRLSRFYNSAAAAAASTPRDSRSNISELKN